jgi:hypothetical protein
MWLKNFINSKLFDRLFNIAMSILVVVLAQSIISHRESLLNIKNEFEKRPTIDQVDLRFKEERIYVDKQDINLNNILQQHIEESNRTSNQMMELIKSVDGNVKILLNKSK